MGTEDHEVAGSSQQHFFIEIDHEIFSTITLSLLLVGLVGCASAGDKEVACLTLVGLAIFFCGD